MAIAICPDRGVRGPVDDQRFLQGFSPVWAQALGKPASDTLRPGKACTTTNASAPN